MDELATTAEVEVGATPEQVWDALTDPARTQRYVFGCAIEGEWRPGSPWRYHREGQPMITGEVLEVEPPRLLRLTARNDWDPTCRHDPPYRLTWEVEPAAGGRTRVRLTQDGFPNENASYRRSNAVQSIAAGLRILLDAGAAAALERLDQIGQAEVRPLTPERLDDYLDLFDNRAFADNPGWSHCYCFNFRFAGTDDEVSRRTGDDNRRDMSEAISSGRAHGLLAYVDGRAVGWCSASPRAEMPQLVRRDWMPADDGAGRIGIIGCLVIAAPYRRHGIARMLVGAAGEYLAGLGCDVAEAYPMRELDSAAHGFYGPLEVYRDLGYETYLELPQRLVVRRRLVTQPA